MNLDEAILQMNNPSFYVIDIGVSDGPGPIWHVVQDSKYKGLLIEGEYPKIPLLFQNLTNPNMEILNTFVTPLNICELFREHRVPYSPDILKLDIDGYDLSILRAILNEYQPKVIVAEINEKIPVPIRFEVLYSPTFVWDQSHFYGCSLQSFADALHPCGYVLTRLDGNNVVAVNTQYIEATQKNLRDLYIEGYANERSIVDFPWNADVFHWLSMETVEDLMHSIQTYFGSKCTAETCVLECKEHSSSTSVNP
jgi:hypothetical protein